MSHNLKPIVHAIAEERAEYLRRHLANLYKCVDEMKKVPWWRPYKFLKYRLGIYSMEHFIKPKMLSLITDYDIHASLEPSIAIGYTNMRFTNFLIANKSVLINLNKLNSIEEDKFLEKLDK